MIRVLHCLGGLERGGIETWLLAMARRLHNRTCRFTIATRSRGPFALDAAFASLGVPVVHVPGHPDPLRYAWNLARLLRDQDVLHSHHAEWAGIDMACASFVGNRHRISHAHNDLRVRDSKSNPVRRAWVATSLGLVRRHATSLPWVGTGAARWHAGPTWAEDPRCTPLPCGIDLDAVAVPVDNAAALRTSLGLSSRDVVLGHVGRLCWQKNQDLLIDMAEHLPDTHRVVLVGGGPDEARLRARLAAGDGGGRVLLLGQRGDVPTLLAGVFDAFVFPSRHEGLGLALVEAQACGLHCLTADSVPPEADVLPAQVSRLPLDAGPAAWAAQAIACSALPRPMARDCRTALTAAGLGLDAVATRLLALYRGAVA